MVIYNPKDWFSLIFRFHKSDTFRRLIWVMLAVGLYSGIVIFLELEYLEASASSSTLVYQLLGFVISLLLVFRTNTAYDRWWEGRKQWGALVNASRNLAIKVAEFIPNTDTHKLKFLELIGEYPDALRLHLRNEKLESRPKEIHQPNQIAQEMYKILFSWHKEGVIKSEVLWIFDNELKELTDICGACERIKKSPIPYSYNIFIKKFIFAYVMAMPFGFVGDYKYAVIPIVMFTLYVLASLELIAEEIEDPFGEDNNDLPTDDLTKTIQHNIQTIASLTKS